MNAHGFQSAAGILRCICSVCTLPIPLAPAACSRVWEFNDEGSIPYVPWLRAPYYVWVGRVPKLEPQPGAPPGGPLPSAGHPAGQGALLVVVVVGTPATSSAPVGGVAQAAGVVARVHRAAHAGALRALHVQARLERHSSYWRLVLSIHPGTTSSYSPTHLRRS